MMAATLRDLTRVLADTARLFGIAYFKDKQNEALRAFLSIHTTQKCSQCCIYHSLVGPDPFRYCTSAQESVWELALLLLCNIRGNARLGVS